MGFAAFTQDFDRFGSGHPIAQDFFVRSANGLDVWLRESVAAHADDVDTREGVAAIGDAEGRDIHGDDRQAGDHRELTDAVELMDDAATGDDGFGVDVRVSGAARVVDEDDIVTDDRVMTNVGVDHQEDAVADDGGDVGFGRGVDGRVFADEAMLSDFDATGGHAELELKILGGKAQAGVGVHSCARADFCGTVDADVADEVDASAERAVAADDAVRADDDVVSENGFGRDDCGGMDSRHGERIIVFWNWRLTIERGTIDCQSGADAVRGGVRAAGCGGGGSCVAARDSACHDRDRSFRRA